MPAEFSWRAPGRSIVTLPAGSTKGRSVATQRGSVAGGLGGTVVSSDSFAAGSTFAATPNSLTKTSQLPAGRGAAEGRVFGFAGFALTVGRGGSTDAAGAPSG